MCSSYRRETEGRMRTGNAEESSLQLDRSAIDFSHLFTILLAWLCGPVDRALRSGDRVCGFKSQDGKVVFLLVYFFLFLLLFHFLHHSSIQLVVCPGVPL